MESEVQLANRCKLRADETIISYHLIDAARIITQMRELGLRTGVATEGVNNYFVSYEATSLGTVSCFGVNRFPNTSSISVEEWLNRHDVFVAGQEVMIEDIGKRIWLHGTTCVTKVSRDCYLAKQEYKTRGYASIKSIYPAWVELQETTEWH